jgi:hypothetical protein
VSKVATSAVCGMFERSHHMHMHGLKFVLFLHKIVAPHVTEVPRGADAPQGADAPPRRWRSLRRWRSPLRWRPLRRWRSPRRWRSLRRWRFLRRWRSPRCWRSLWRWRFPRGQGADASLLTGHRPAEFEALKTAVGRHEALHTLNRSKAGRLLQAKYCKC